MAYTRRAVFQRPQAQWLAPVQVGPATIADASVQPETIGHVVDVLRRLEPDDYLEFMLGYYEQGRERFGRHWQYMDLLTVLHGAATLLQPEDYLEIGVRRGRSVAVVAAAAAPCAIVGFDLWVQDYAGMRNPGPEFVRGELEKVGHRGSLELISGDSKTTVPAFLRDHPDRTFDLITVDGDHSEQGAGADLANVLPRLRVGGVIVLDDLVHPDHPHLAVLWERFVASDARFAGRTYTELGYGVAFAVRRE